VKRTEIADRGDAGERLDLALRRRLADLDRLTRTRVQDWIEAGLVSVNGMPVRRVASRLSAGDSIVVDLPDLPPRPGHGAEDIGLEVVLEDEHMIAVNKPPGLVAHPSHAHSGGTVLNALLWRARAWPAGTRPSLVSRLDKHTSGLVLAAKTAAMHAALQRALAAPGAAKDYLAVVYGRVGVARGSIDLRLQRDAADRRRVVASASSGAPSLTRFERLATARAPRAGLALLRCRLVTGRTHQIRVHLASRGWPIVGDPVYGEPRWQSVEDEQLRDLLHAFPRQALHALRLRFAHPVGGAPVEIEAPVPADLAALLDHVRAAEARRARC
jgi:23S rRNA pseudouridine1911/1915/1917 synthase